MVFHFFKEKTLFISSFCLATINMEKIEVKFFTDSELAQKPTQATSDSAGYDLFSAEAKTILPQQSNLVSLDLRWAIPKGFCGKILSRSSLIANNMVTVEGGLIDSDYRGIVNVILMNYSNKPFTVRTGDRIAQVIFLRRFDVNFIQVSQKEELGKTERDEGGFGSTSPTVIKKIKLSEDEELEIISEEAKLMEEGKVVTWEKIEKKK